MVLFGYCAKMNFNKDKNTLIGNFNPLHPYDRYSVGLIGRPSRRLNIYTDIKGDMANNLETSFGFRTKFSGGTVSGNFGLSGKSSANYKH